MITENSSALSKSIDIEMGNEDDSVTSQTTSSTISCEPTTYHKHQLHLRFSHLRKEVEVQGKKKKVVLNNVCGRAITGVTAIMGASGSGKTTLMNVLSGRAAYDKGSISVNGVELDKAGMKKLQSKIAYIKQQDILFGQLTVLEQLTYTAQLKISDKSIKKNKRKEKIKNEVDRIIKVLRLTKVSDSKICMLSGGEKKRVNIGTELIGDPSIIFLDEPTSGLDSCSTAILLAVLRDLADQGKTILMSIHQPTSEAFFSFDELLMLSDGQVVYFGKPKDSLNYLSNQGYPCPNGVALADHWLKLLVADSTEKESSNLHLQEAWDNDKADTNNRTFEELSSAVELNNSLNLASNECKYNTTWWTQFTTLLHRSYRKNISRIFSPLRVFKAIGVGIIVGILMFNQKYTKEDASNIYSYIFYSNITVILDASYEALYSLPGERIVILKERANASYYSSAYFAATTITDLPMAFMLPFLYITISYWMVLPTLGFITYLAMLGFCWLAVLNGQAIGQFLSAAINDVAKAQVVLSMFICTMLLLGGYFLPKVPFYLKWIQYISPFSNSSSATILFIFDRSPSIIINEEMFGRYGANGSIGLNVGTLLLMTIIPRIGTYFILRRKKCDERE